MVPSRTSLEKETGAPSPSRDGAGSESASATAPPPAAAAAAVGEKQEPLAKTPTVASHAGGQSLGPRPTREDGAEYPTGAKLALITLALCLSVFLMALDNSIIATAIPKITDQFNSLGDVGWYGSGTYILRPPPALLHPSSHKRLLVLTPGAQPIF